MMFFVESDKAEMTINITVVTHNRLDLTKICLQSLLEKTKGQYYLTIIDNASNDGTKEYINTLSNLYSNINIFYLQTNMGVAVVANLGWASFDADYYIKLDNDIEICDNTWLEQLVSIVEHNKNIAMAGYLLLNWKCKKEYITLQSGNYFISSDLCNGGCVIIPRHIHENLGFWIEDHGKYGYEDKNYSDRAVAAGYLIGYIPADMLPVRHLGFEEGHIDNVRESAKKKNREEKYFGEHLYVFNKLLFDNGIRKLL
ncbi:MAG: glycosyltransferase [Desulfovibrio sp.]|nr:glycosyltransferase [Desulfovibrio sp.]